MPDPSPFDASKVRMSVDPPLSASVAYVQGTNVKQDTFFARVSPAVGRGPTKLFFSSSKGGVRNLTDENFFDDSILGSVGLNASTGSAPVSTESAIFISSDIGKLENRWSYDMVGYTYGITDLDPLSSEPYRDKEELDPVKYITNPDSIQWPVVLEDPAAIDPYDFNALLEPIAIRGPIVGTSTFVGDDFDPEPTGVRGDMSGEYFEEPYHRTVFSSTTYIKGSKEKIYPWGFVVDKRIMEGFSKFIHHDYSYTADDEEKIDPYVDVPLNDRLFKTVGQADIRKYLINNIKASADDRPDPNSSATSRGFEYENSEFGIDSLAFGGLLR